MIAKSMPFFIQQSISLVNCSFCFTSIIFDMLPNVRVGKKSSIQLISQMFGLTLAETSGHVAKYYILSSSYCVLCCQTVPKNKPHNYFFHQEKDHFKPDLQGQGLALPFNSCTTSSRSRINWDKVYRSIIQSLEDRVVQRILVPLLGHTMAKPFVHFRKKIEKE